MAAAHKTVKNTYSGNINAGMCEQWSVDDTIVLTYNSLYRTAALTSAA